MSPTWTWGFEYITILGDHEDRDEVHDGQGQKLSLLRLLHISVDDGS